MELSQRVVLYYVLFYVLGAIVLCAGIFYSAQEYLVSRAESRGLAMVGQAVPRILIPCLKGDQEKLDSTLQSLHREQRLLFASVTDTNNVIVSSTGKANKGALAREVVGAKEKWGAIESIRYENADQIRICEYRAPLVSGSQNFGSIRLAVPDHSIWDSFSAAYDHILLALTLPLVILAIGAFVLRKCLTPISAVESQILDIAKADLVNQGLVSTVDGSDWTTSGWNKIVSFLQNGPVKTRDKIQDAVAHYRQNQALEVLNSLPDGLAVTDSSNDIKLNNAAFLSLFEYTQVNDSPIGKNIADFLNAHLDADDANATSPDWDSGEAVSEIKRTFGEHERVLRVARYRLRSHSGSQSNLSVWSIRDVTQQKLTEKMRDEFLDSATHELRTPLSNIKAYAETLAISEILDVDQQKEFCNTINSEATRLARFIDDLLSISNVEAGSLAITRENVEVDRMMRDIVTKIKPIMVGKDIEFNVNMPQKTLPSISIDKDKIQVAMVNILGNAAKYTAQGGRVDVFVKLANGQVEFSVEDSGVGIRPEDLPRIFEKFYRCADEDIQNETGTGLGLSLADEIIRLHGGKISVDSEYGKGSKFTILLPANSGVLA